MIDWDLLSGTRKVLASPWETWGNTRVGCSTSSSAGGRDHLVEIFSKNLSMAEWLTMLIASDPQLSIFMEGMSGHCILSVDQAQNTFSGRTLPTKGSFWFWTQTSKTLCDCYFSFALRYIICTRYSSHLVQTPGCGWQNKLQNFLRLDGYYCQILHINEKNWHMIQMFLTYSLHIITYI